MTTYNEITNSRLQQKIKHAATHVPKQFQNMIDDIREGKDFIVKLGQGVETKFTHNGYDGIVMNTSLQDFTMHDNATGQLARKYGISVRELKKYMSGSFGGGQGWQDDVVAFLLNQHAHHAKQERFFVRAVRNEARAVLSENYKVLDSEIILTKFIETAMKAGAVFIDGSYTGLKVFVEMIMPHTIPVRTENNGDIDVAYGVQIRTSDYGAGQLELRSFIMNAVCTNGMVGNSVLQMRHLGEKLPEGFEYAKETIIANSNRTKLVVRDLTQNLLDERNIRQKLVEIETASRFKIDIKTELGKLAELGMLKGEIDDTEVILLNNRADDGMQGENTLWKLAQAVSAVAREAEPERQRELQETAQKLMPSVKQAELSAN